MPLKPKSTADVQADARKELETEAKTRLSDARNEKSTIQNDLQNCYFYAAPRRVRQQSSTAQSTTRSSDDRQLQTSFGFEVVDDFASMLIETFMPREGRWAERSLPAMVDQDGDEVEEIKELNEQIKAEDKRVFDLIRASNFYAEAAKAAVPDASVGICAMLITDPGRGRPMLCRGVAIRELEFDIGPDGRPDYRAIVRTRKYRYLAAELGEIASKLPDEEARKIKESPDATVEIVWCWWRNWVVVGDIAWIHCVLVNGKLIHNASMAGEGSCAMLVGRFGATPDFAWPDGPLVKSLADLVSLDEVRGALIENLDFSLRSPMAYEDDGVINIPPEGLRPGDLLPKRQTYGKAAFEKIYQPNPIDAALFEVDHLVMRIRRLHYVDLPEQKGKTPPTAAQWTDELVLRQRRIGTPGYAFWREYPYEVFQRFRFLGEARGAVRKIETFSGIPANADLQPYNPAERAADSQDVATAVRFAEIGMALAPQTWELMHNGIETLKNIKAKMRADDVVLRSEEEMREQIKTLAPILGGMMGGGGQGPEGGGQPA